MRIHFLPCLQVAAKLLPRPESGNAGGGGHVPCDLQHVPKAAIVKTAHGRQAVREGVRVSGLQLLSQQLHVGGDEVPFGGVLLAVAFGYVLANSRANRSILKKATQESTYGLRFAIRDPLVPLLLYLTPRE